MDPKEHGDEMVRVVSSRADVSGLLSCIGMASRQRELILKCLAVPAGSNEIDEISRGASTLIIEEIEDRVAQREGTQ